MGRQHFETGNSQQNGRANFQLCRAIHLKTGGRKITHLALEKATVARLDFDGAINDRPITRAAAFRLPNFIILLQNSDPRSLHWAVPVTKPRTAGTNID